jgi:serine/threonine protein kinase
MTPFTKARYSPVNTASNACSASAAWGRRRGEHLQLDERVALKFLLPDALNNPESVARFAREARAAVKIKSLHVARVSTSAHSRQARRTW